jgi:hypothetical protein
MGSLLPGCRGAEHRARLLGSGHRPLRICPNLSLVNTRRGDAPRLVRNFSDHQQRTRKSATRRNDQGQIVAEVRIQWAQVSAQARKRICKRDAAEQAEPGETRQP